LSDQQPVEEAAQETVVVPVEVTPEEPPVSPPPAVIAMPEPFRPMNGDAKTVARRRQGNETQLRLF